MMAIQTRIKFKSFVRAVQEIAIEKNLSCRPYNGKAGSAICFEFFKDNNDIPIGVFCVHEDKKAKVIYSDDLKKACKQLTISKEEFEDYCKKL